MSTISLRIPDHLHERVRELAAEQNVSINQFITLAVSEKTTALMTADYLAERANRGNRKKFDNALAKVRSDEPDEADRF